MSKPLSKPELIRAQWLYKLAHEGHRQCVNHLAFGDRRCALGLLVDIVYPEEEVGDCMSIGHHCVDPAIKAAGLSQHQGAMVASLNDGVRRVSTQEWEERERAMRAKRAALLPYCMTDSKDDFFVWNLPHEERQHSFTEIKAIVESWFK